MNLQFLLSQNVDHHFRILQAIIPVFIVMPFLTLEHSLPQIALNFSAAPLVSSKQIDGMIDCLGRCCDILAGVGVVGDGTDCVVLAVSVLFQWFDVSELFSLFEAGKGFDQILESYFVILRDYLAIILKASLPFRRNVTISPYFRTYNFLTPAILSPRLGTPPLKERILPLIGRLIDSLILPSNYLLHQSTLHIAYNNPLPKVDTPNLLLTLRYSPPLILDCLSLDAL